MSVTDRLLRNNEEYAASFDKSGLPAPPARKVAVLACMDARLDVHKILGLEEGDAHVIRNAGGVATEDTIRSLLISQRLLGTEEVIVINHTDCGMAKFSEEDVKRAIEEETGVAPSFSLGAFEDVDQHVRECVAAIRENPFIPNDSVRGFVYEVETGRLREIDAFSP